MDYKNVLSFLETLRPSKFRMELDSLIEACHEMDQPQLKFPSVHIAGTNGKGSTAAFLSSITTHNKLKTGMLTSPHILNVTERIRINGKSITNEKFTEVANKLLDKLVAPKQLSYFEFITLIAYEYFAEEKVNVAVVETGLGGRLDATNLIKSEVVVMTSISLDHQKHLGSKIEEIAKEKCGIIKRGVPTVSAIQLPEVFEVLRRACDDTGSPLIIVDPLPEDVKLGLAGEHQRQNAACAVEAAELLTHAGIVIKDVYTGLEKAKWPGRLETVSSSPRVIVDGAHNPAGANALANYISSKYDRSKSVLLLGSLADKDVSSMCRSLIPVVREVICVCPPSSRAASPKDVAAAARSFGATVHVAKNVTEALDKWLPTLSPEDTVFVTGSFTTVGEAMTYFKRSTK